VHEQKDIPSRSRRRLQRALSPPGRNPRLHQDLEEKGFIRRDDNRGRAMEVVLPDSMVGASAPTDKTRFIPLVGRIAAGGPITAEQDVEEIVPLPESLVGSGDLFMLKVVGN